MIAEIVTLFLNFSDIEGLTAARPTGTFHATSMKAMRLATTELVLEDFALHECVMDEGFYYRMEFKPNYTAWPPIVNLCYLATGTSVPSLALMYRDKAGRLKQHTRAGYVAPSTDSATARLMMTSFQSNRFLNGLKPFWMPVFDGSPFALER